MPDNALSIASAGEDTGTTLTPNAPVTMTTLSTQPYKDLVIEKADPVAVHALKFCASKEGLPLADMFEVIMINWVDDWPDLLRLQAEYVAESAEHRGRVRRWDAMADQWWAAQEDL